MKLENLSSTSNIQDLFILKPESFYDFRGENFEGYDDEKYQEIFSSSEEWQKQQPKFLIDSYSKSSKNSLRGFHGDQFAWKLIDCLKGSIYFVVLDTRKNSKTYGIHQAFNLNEHNKLQILVPNGCVNAHLCVSEECLFHYKLTHKYVAQKDQIHVKWNDPSYNIFWPIKNPILSQRDQ
jgi:dTDP-4-dehydrorhamnose 3,5-epimerase